MTTTVTHSIGSGGRDYSTQNAWNAAMPGDLVSADQAWVGELYNDSEFVISSAWGTISANTDATRNILLHCATGQSFRDNASKLSNALFYNSANGVGVRTTSAMTAILGVASHFCTVEGIQFQNAVNTDYHDGGCVQLNGAVVTTLLQNCIGFTTTTNYNNYTFNGINGMFMNCLAICANLATGFISGGAYTACLYYACTTAHFGTTTGSFGFRRNSGYGNDQVYSCVAINNAADFSSPVGWAVGDYDVSSDGSASGIGTHHVTGAVASNEFVSSTSDFRVKAGSVLIGAGYPGLVTDDILGQTRDPSAPTAGCFEYVVSAAGFPPELIGQPRLNVHLRM